MSKHFVPHEGISYNLLSINDVLELIRQESIKAANTV